MCDPPYSDIVDILVWSFMYTTDLIQNVHEYDANYHMEDIQTTHTSIHNSSIEAVVYLFPLQEHNSIFSEFIYLNNQFLENQHLYKFITYM